MLEQVLDDDVDVTIADKKRAAFEMLTDAMADAEAEGIERDIVTQAALFAAMIDLVATYGEDAVSDYVAKLPERVRNGEFSVDRVLQ